MDACANGNPVESSRKSKRGERKKEKARDEM